MKNREIAEYTLEALTKAGADGAQVIVLQGTTDELNVDGGQFSLMRTLFNSSISIKALKGGRKGTAAINQFSKEAIDDAVKSCISSAESGVADEAERIAPFDGKESFKTGIFEPDMGLLYDRMNELMSDIKENYPKVVLEQFISEYEREETLFMNTNGTEFSHEDGSYGVSTMFSAHEGDKASSFNGYEMGLNNLDTRLVDVGLQRALFEEAEHSLDTRVVDGKFVGPVIITPACLGDILYYLVENFLSDLVIIDKTSAWFLSLGKLVTDPRFSLSSIPLNSRIIGGERFTMNGFKSENMDIIKDGVLQGFILGDYASQKSGFTRAKNLGMNFAVTPGEKPLSDIMASVPRGLIVNRFSGGDPAQNGDFSGVAKNSFLVKNGKVTDAVSETMISGNLAEIFRSIREISRETVCAGSSVLPWISFDGMTVSGK